MCRNSPARLRALARIDSRWAFHLRSVDDSQVFVGVYDVDIFFINRKREWLTCVFRKVAKRKNNGLGGRETASPGLGPSRCSQHACLETVHSLRKDVFRDSLVDGSIIRVQFCLGLLNSRYQVVDKYCKEYWSKVGPLRDASRNRVEF